MDGLIYVKLTIYAKTILALIDSGASRSVVRRKEFMELCKHVGRSPILSKAVELIGVTGHDIKVKGATQLPIDQVGPIDFIVVEDINHPMIIGRDILRAYKAIIDYDQGVLKWNDRTWPLLPQPSGGAILTLGDHPPLMRSPLIEKCVTAHEHIFAAKGEPLGCHPDIMVRIETEGPPVRRRPYRVPLAKRKALDDQLEDLLNQGIIEPSSSPWASPVVMVQKKDPQAAPRFTVDYTALNKQLKKDAYPIPLIRDIFDQLQGASVFSTLDLKSGFHQLPIHPDDKEKTAFICHAGLFNWLRMPMGLATASARFQRAMEKVLEGLLGKFALLYIDDVIIYSRNETDHALHLSAVFQRFEQYQLTLNPAKCVFGMAQVKLLGYIVSEKGLSGDPEKIAAIKRMQEPANVKQVRAFLGMSGYYRTLIKDYAHIAEPLVALTKKNHRFVWTEAQQKAFEALKDALISDQVMAHPCPDKEYLLYCDACDHAVGAILCQKDDQGIERPIVYVSKQLSDSQRKWATIEREAYGLIHALKTLRPYLWGSKYRCFVDHKPLTSLFTKDFNNTKIQRWSILLAEYGCKVEYHKGRLNVRADMLSRIKQKEDIATLDAPYWHLEKPIPLPEDQPSTEQTYGLDLQVLAEQQRAMTQWTEHHDEDSDYEVVNGLLYSVKRPHKQASYHHRLVVPPQQRPQVIERAHKETGHMSVIKTLRKLQDAFVWPGMREDITRWIAKCPICIAYSNRKPHVPMGDMPVAKAPMELVAADLIGPLVESPEGNKYILSMIDHATCWAECYPIKNKTSHEVWKKLTREFFPRHGYVSTLLTDRGLEFGAEALTSYLKDLGIEHRRTTSYHPEANGKCERLNATIKKVIARLVNNNRSAWEDQLGPALMAYNNVVSEATHHTPYYLLYGRRARLPLSRLLRTDEMADGRLQDVAEALKAAAARTKDARLHNRRRLAKKANAGQLSVGDHVTLLVNEPLTMTSRWDPYWQVVQIRGKVIWIVHQQTATTRRVNRDKVKVVDPEVAWDELAPRPKRAAEKRAQQDRQLQRHLAATDPPRGQDQGARHPSVKRPAQQHHAQSTSAQPKRHRSYDVTASTHHPPNKRRPQRTGHSEHLLAPEHKHYQRAAEKRARNHLDTHARKLPKRRGVIRPAPPIDVQSQKRVKSRGITRPPEDTNHSAGQQRKRQRPLLRRAAKRHWPAEDPAANPSTDDQKKQRLEAIDLLIRFLSKAEQCTN